MWKAFFDSGRIMKIASQFLRVRWNSELSGASARIRKHSVREITANLIVRLLSGLVMRPGRGKIHANGADTIRKRPLRPFANKGECLYARTLIERHVRGYVFRSHCAKYQLASPGRAEHFITYSESSKRLHLY